MMLVIGRTEGEKILIDGNIELEIVRVKGNKVSIGLSAPKEVRILRSELLERDRSNASK